MKSWPLSDFDLKMKQIILFSIKSQVFIKLVKLYRDISEFKMLKNPFENNKQLSLMLHFFKKSQLDLPNLKIVWKPHQPTNFWHPDQLTLPLSQQPDSQQVKTFLLNFSEKYFETLENSFISH